MATRADVDRIAVLNRGISDLVIRDLEAFWATLDLSRPEDARNRLLTFLPTLIAQYGDISATVSADWYSDMREQAGAKGRFAPILAPNVPVERVNGTVRRLAEHLFTDTPQKMLEGLTGRTAEYALQAGRDTIDISSKRDPWRPRVARVPTGVTTCKFCLLLASRGAVYSSKQSAGALTKFHPHDDCQIVVVGNGQDLPEGYDPDELYEEYKSTRTKKPTGKPDPAELAKASELNRLSYEANARGDIAERDRLQAEARDISRAAYNAAGVGLDS